jgi:hypothetical protein
MLLKAGYPVNKYCIVLWFQVCSTNVGSLGCVMWLNDVLVLFFVSVWSGGLAVEHSCGDFSCLSQVWISA